jgi:predicted amidohydrolase
MCVGALSLCPLAHTAESTSPPAPTNAAPSNTVRVAGIVLKWIRANKAENYRRAEPMIRQAAAGGAKIVCTTECFLDGYAIADKSIPLDVYRALGEPIPGGPYFNRLLQLADELDVHVIAGMLEADGDTRYNSAVVLGPDGKLVGKYRKQKLGHELVRNTPGTESRIWKTPYGKLGVMICADRTEPNIVQRFCAAGADFLICPSGGMFGPRQNDHILQARSRENEAYIVFVHPAEFLVTDPQGGIVTAELFGDRLLIDKSDIDKEVDSRAIRYFDLPLTPAAEAAADIANAESPRKAVSAPAINPEAEFRNGDFSSWPGYSGKGVTTTSVGVPPNSIPEHWYGGPGVGATASYGVVPFPSDQSDVPGKPKQHLRVTWHKPPSDDWPGETHHVPDYRCSFLENFSIKDVRRYAGQTLLLSFHGRAIGDPVDVIPIMWHSYDSETPGIVAVKGKGYELFEPSGKPGAVAIAQGAPCTEAVCHLTDKWQRFERMITLPATDGKSITAGHYTGLGFDLTTRYKGVIDLANIELHPMADAKARN